MKYLVLLCLLCSCASMSAINGEASRPHIIWIIADDLGYADLGFTGCADIPTPHLDSLAARGVACTDGHVSASVCAPSRAGLITGRTSDWYGQWVDLDELAGEGDHMVGQPIADDGIARLAEINAGKKKIVRKRSEALG